MNVVRLKNCASGAVGEYTWREDKTKDGRWRVTITDYCNDYVVDKMFETREAADLYLAEFFY